MKNRGLQVRDSQKDKKGLSLDDALDAESEGRQ
jgi:hypothetical protein